MSKSKGLPKCRECSFPICTVCPFEEPKRKPYNPEDMPSDMRAIELDSSYIEARSTIDRRGLAR